MSVANTSVMMVGFIGLQAILFPRRPPGVATRCQTTPLPGGQRDAPPARCVPSRRCAGVSARQLRVAVRAAHLEAEGAAAAGCQRAVVRNIACSHGLSIYREHR